MALINITVTIGQMNTWLEQIAVLAYVSVGDCWICRARGKNTYVRGASADVAMQNAIAATS